MTFNTSEILKKLYRQKRNNEYTSKARSILQFLRVLF